MKKSYSRPVSTRLGNLEQEFDARCQSEGLSASQLLRRALIDYLRKPNSIPSFTVENKHDFVEKKKVVVSFTESEYAALGEVVKTSYNVTYQAVIVGMVRAYLTAEPFLNEQEIMVMRDANKQLLAIGRNLNQIVRAMNSGTYNEKYGINDDYLMRLLGACDKHAAYFQGIVTRATQRKKIGIGK